MGGACSRPPPRRRVHQTRTHKFQFHVFGSFYDGYEKGAYNFMNRLELSDTLIDEESQNDVEEIYHDGGVIAQSRIGNRCGWDQVGPLYDQWYFSSGKEAVISVVDSTSSTDLIKQVIYSSLVAGLGDMSFRNIVLMIVADNQDLEGAHSPEQIESIVKGMTIPGWYDVPWFVVPCRSVISDDAKVAYRYLRKLSRLNSKGQLEHSLIPTACAWEQANQIQENEEDDDDVSEYEEGVVDDDMEENNPQTAEEDKSLSKFYGMKKCFKKHLKSIRSFLSY